MAAGTELVVTDGDGFTAICTEADLVASVTDVAVTVAGVAPVGAAAVYVTDVEDLALSDPGPFTLHRTPALLVSFATEAIKPSVWL